MASLDFPRFKSILVITMVKASKPSQKGRANVTIALDIEDIERIDEIAKREGLSRADVIRQTFRSDPYGITRGETAADPGLPKRLA